MERQLATAYKQTELILNQVIGGLDNLPAVKSAVMEMQLVGNSLCNAQCNTRLLNAHVKFAWKTCEWRHARLSHLLARVAYEHGAATAHACS